METKKINRRDFAKMAGGAAVATAGLLAAPHIARAQGERVVIATTAGSQAMTLSQLITDQGYLDEFGLTAEFIPVADGARVLASVISGEVDICMGTGIPNILPAIERGGSIKIISTAQNYVNSVIFSGSPEIQTIADLRGKQIGTGSIGSQVHIYMSALLREAGIGLNEVEFVNIGGSAAIFRAVAGGIIDAGPGEPELMYEADDYGVQVIGPVWELLPQMIGQASYASDRTIADKRDIIVRTLAAYRRLYQFINGPDSLDAFVAARNTAMRDEDDESATNQWRILQENRNMADDLVLPRDRIEWLQELNIALGVQQRILPYEEVTDVSIAEEALALETSA